MTRPFATSAEFALVVHPDEVNSTVGTAWILRRSVSNLKWIRSNGDGLDQDAGFLKLIEETKTENTVPLLLFPGNDALNLSITSDHDWQNTVPQPKRPLFIVIDGTWNQARMILRKSAILQSLPRVSFETDRLSEYGFKRQPHPACLSSVEGVHRILEILAARGWASIPTFREHDQMIEIFRAMIKFQLSHEN